MIRPNLEAKLEAKKEALEEVKSDTARVRVLISRLEEKLIKLNSSYSDLIFEIEDLEEQIEEVKENYED